MDKKKINEKICMQKILIKIKTKKIYNSPGRLYVICHTCSFFGELNLIHTGKQVFINPGVHPHIRMSLFLSVFPTLRVFSRVFLLVARRHFY